MTAVERFQELDAWPTEWWDGYEPTDEEVDARRTAVTALWAELTDEERAAAGAWRVSCAVCKRDYGRGISPTQADDCAARIAKGADGQLYLTCHYLSISDGDAYAMHSSDSDVPIAEADPVCDTCVLAYKKAGALELVGDFFHAAVAERVFPHDNGLVVAARATALESSK